MLRPASLAFPTALNLGLRPTIWAHGQAEDIPHLVEGRRSGLLERQQGQLRSRKKARVEQLRKEGPAAAEIETESRLCARKVKRNGSTKEKLWAIL